MADAYFIFRKRMPFSVRLDNGSSWTVSIQTGGKSGYVTIVASARHAEGKFYILTSGKEDKVDAELRCGIRVAAGTPERGLVSAMRRAGVVIVMAERLPRVPV